MLGQTFQFGDLGIVVFLIILEALLSADNALVLAIMVRHLPKEEQKRALLYGLGGAFIFRLAAILLATTIISLWWLQVIGAIYLLALPIKHFINAKKHKEVVVKGAGFWQTVIAVEIADIAFAIDSVLAGVAMVKSASKIWVVYFGAIIGVVLLRFAANFFIKILEKFPSLDHVAYLLVGWVGVKLAFMSAHNFGIANPGSIHIEEMPQVVFWGVLLAIAGLGTLWSIRKGAKDEEERIALDAHDAERIFSDDSEPDTPVANPADPSV